MMERISTYGRARLDDRQVSELIGIAHGLMADNELKDSEIAYLHRWLVANSSVTDNPVVGTLIAKIHSVLADFRIDDEERAGVAHLLASLCRNDFEIGEVLKATSLPLDSPPPVVRIQGAVFCFTGTFSFGSRAECENAVAERGGNCGSLTRKTQYLVIGEYATDSWAHSSFGRKIENAVELRAQGLPLAIISEQHWRKAL
jgi:NAD-dependent DNA ligase